MSTENKFNVVSAASQLGIPLYGQPKTPQEVIKMGTGMHKTVTELIKYIGDNKEADVVGNSDEFDNFKRLFQTARVACIELAKEVGLIPFIKLLKKINTDGFEFFVMTALTATFAERLRMDESGQIVKGGSDE